MRQEIVLKHEFVEFIPDELKEGTIYVSIRFATATHLCCCGCGSRVVTPLRPTDTMGCSVFPRQNRCRRAHDRCAKEKYFNAGATADDSSTPTQKPETAEPAQAEKGFWRKLKKLWSR
jgi:hypothetical protein